MSRPNYFIGIRLNSPGFYAAMAAMQSLLVQKYPSLSRCLVPLEKLHLTCFVMNLASQEEIQSARSIFDASRGFIAEKMSKLASKSLSFSRVDVFPTKVIFTSPDECETMDALREITLHLKHTFQQHSLWSDVNHIDWTPHVTIAKTSADRRNGRKLKIQQSHSDYFSIEQPGVLHQLASEMVPLSVIELLSMERMASDKYYLSIHTIDLLDSMEDDSVAKADVSDEGM
jgi:2'-5' RNA ligase